MNLIKNPLKSLCKRQIGDTAEQNALMFLKQQGLVLVERNFQCRMGEIDLIMQDQEQLVFIEVRHRQRSHYGLSEETITYGKQKKIKKTALFYLHQKQLFEKIACRFDVLALSGEIDNPSINWIPSAFD